ncbi:MAG: threonine--tRNA ligase [Patescibacteria group bacterium]
MSVPKNSQNLMLDTQRHSIAHLLAAAVKEMFPETQFGVGPVIETGCYYDFILPRTLIPEDLPLIEQKMKDLLKRDLAYKVQELSAEEAVLLFETKGQRLKVELLRDLISKGTTKLSEEEKADFDLSGGLKITVYRIVDEQTGEILFEDLCKGPHVSKISELKKLGFKLDKFSGSYWRGDQDRNIQMQRIYALVYDSKDALEKFRTQREETRKRDHRLIGQQLELFMTSEEIGAGLPLFLPKGALLRQILERYMNQVQTAEGYKYVFTPHIGKKDLFERSGHLDHYAENMYAPIDMVNLKGEGKVAGKAEQFYLKPMNCPMHHHIYLSKPRSYRDLPYKLMEYGTVYRYEESGVLAGLIRVRGFTQNDAHVYCTHEQIKDVVKESLISYQKVYTELGISEYKFRFSLPDFENDAEKYGLETEEWKIATKYLREALDESGIDYYDGVGEAAFYGPKIDVQVRNVNGKEDTLSTIQVDFSIAPKFEITYTNSAGEQQVPAIMHRALMGSIERFMAFLIESCGGRFPFWLAPEQVRILTVNNQDNVLDYVSKIKSILSDIVLMKPLKYNEIRHELDDRNESLGRKIREAETQKIPVILIVGPKDVENNQVSVRTHINEEKVKLEKLKYFLENL